MEHGFKVSVVIPSSPLRDTILPMDSLKRQTYPIEEVIPIKGYKLTQNRNLGIKKAKGNIVVFLDDDITLDKDCIKNLLTPFFKYQNVGGVTGKVIGEENKPHFLKHLYYCYARLFFLPYEKNGKFLLSGHPTSYQRKWKDIVPVECLGGCLMAFRKKVLLEFMCDENLAGGRFMEDDDLSRRVSKKYQNYYVPFAEVYHFQGKREPDRYRAYCFMKNFIYLNKKNFSNNFFRWVIVYWSILGLLLMEIIRKKEAGKGMFSALLEHFGIKSSKVYS